MSPYRAPPAALIPADVPYFEKGLCRVTRRPINGCCKKNERRLHPPSPTHEPSRQGGKQETASNVAEASANSRL
jgi:hypothetical protein